MAGTARSNFEYRCLEPGLWHIEGYQVHRVRMHGQVRWAVKPLASRNAADIKFVDTLDDAFELIWDQLAKDK